MSKTERTGLRKFSEKIAQLNRKEIKATAEFERIIKEVQVTKEVLIGPYRRKSAHQLSSSASYLPVSIRQHQPVRTSDQPTSGVYLAPSLAVHGRSAPGNLKACSSSASNEASYQASRPVPSIQIFPIEFEPDQQQQQQATQQHQQVSSQQYNLRPFFGGGLSGARSMPNVSDFASRADEQYYDNQRLDYLQQPETSGSSNQLRSRCQTDFSYQTVGYGPSACEDHSSTEYGDNFGQSETDSRWSDQPVAGSLQPHEQSWQPTDTGQSGYLDAQYYQPSGKLVRAKSSQTISSRWLDESSFRNKLEPPLQASSQLSRSASHSYGGDFDQNYSMSSKAPPVGSAYPRNGQLIRRSSYSNFGRSLDYYADLRPQPTIVAASTATTTAVAAPSQSQHHLDEQQLQSSYVGDSSYCQCYQCTYYR